MHVSECILRVCVGRVYGSSSSVVGKKGLVVGGIDVVRVCMYINIENSYGMSPRKE